MPAQKALYDKGKTLTKARYGRPRREKTTRPSDKLKSVWSRPMPTLSPG